MMNLILSNATYDISLNGIEPIKAGLEKLVFMHPTQPGVLIKIISPTYIGNMYKRWPILMRYERAAHYWIFLKEIAEYMSANARSLDNRFHLQKIIGLIETDKGLGLMTEAILQRDGSLAKTLGDLLSNGAFGVREHAEFLRFCDWAATAPLVLRDFSVQNLVWNESKEVFVIIDGIGGRIRPSLRSISHKYNLRRNRLEVEQLKRTVNLRLINQLS